MKIVITRPTRQATQLARLIRARQAVPITFPTIEIEPINYSQPTAKPAIIIFLSANAVWHSNLSIEMLRNSTIIAIGSGTKAALLKHPTAGNFAASVITPADYNSEALLALMQLKSPQVKNKHISVVCGENGRSLARDALRERGAIVTEIICYRRSEPQYSAANLPKQLINQKVDLIITTSLNSLINLNSIINKHSAQLNNLKNAKLLVISRKMQSLADSSHWKKNNIITAANATDAAIINTLENL